MKCPSFQTANNTSGRLCSQCGAGLRFLTSMRASNVASGTGETVLAVSQTTTNVNTARVFMLTVILCVALGEMSWASGIAVAVAASNTLHATAGQIDNSCRMVVAALDKAAQTPFHETVSASGKHYEKIQTSTTLYLGSNGNWRVLSSSPKQLSTSASESGLTLKGCAAVRKESIDGESATVYSMQESMQGSDENYHGEIWIDDSSALPLKSETNGTHEGRKSHISTHYTYTDVRAPTGAK